MSLSGEARVFVNTLSGVLNGTITDGIRISYKGDRRGAAGAVGYRITKDDLVGELIPISIGKDPTCWLALNQAVTLTEDGYLKTVRARMAVYADEEGEHSLLRYDFDREAENPYPTTHIQIDAESEACRILSERCGTSPQFEDFHLPVGGVRFRPSLEDVIEFLIVEEIADHREGWKELIDRERRIFYERQLRAAVRNNPDAAVQQLRAMGYTIEQPPEE